MFGAVGGKKKLKRDELTCEYVSECDGHEVAVQDRCDDTRAGTSDTTH